MAPALLLLVALAALPSFITAQSAATLESCLASSSVPTISRKNATWAVEAAPWQLRIKANPALITYPTTKEQVAAALKCARSSSVKVSAMAAGHSMVGFGFGFDGNLVVNMSAFNKMEYDAATTNFKIGAGVRVGPAAKKLWDGQGRTFPHVRHGRVGIVGSMIGGGFGTISRFRGVPMDSLVCVEYMLYNGTIVDAGVGSDLFWAARGAGSSFGVILSVTIKTYAVDFPTAVQYNLTVGAGTIEAASQDLAAGVKTLLAVQKFATTTAPDRFSMRWDISTHKATGQYYGDPSTFDSKVRQPLLELTKGINVTITSSEDPFWEVEKASCPGIHLPDGGSSPKRAFYVQALTPTADKPLTAIQFTAFLNATINTFYRNNRTDVKRSGFFDLWGGVSKYVKDSDTAFAHGNKLWLMRLDGNGVDNIFPADGVTYFKNLLKPFEEALKRTQKLKGFGNYRDTALPRSEWSQRLYGDNWARLVRIKKAIDPEGMFTSNLQSIPVSG
ncbi:putative glucooligosaccharide oxidase [Venturia nashicola]|uniref:Putative glucooligosaccharide oxidase n=1 Tax=Venturia nashicola TaxID=86259 RepID=A0A4Z1PJ85_9PEZI|nr:putative glucooligosaccharide oxidase [Venturia nashicola]TLD39769.1 putative glucooligosaccharide oxidase [Venturia nashicola]